jgi:hypothetical protein
LTGSFAISANGGARDSLRLGGFGSVGRSSADGELIANLVVLQERDGSQGTSAGEVVTVAHWQADEKAPHLTK